MISRKKLWQSLFKEGNIFGRVCSRCYSSKIDLRQLRPMILKRIENRAKDYPVREMIPVAKEVLRARTQLIEGVTSLLEKFPVAACKFCPEVYIGEKGHLIQTCHGYRRQCRNRVHEWINGGLRDILVPVETFHLENMFQGVIKHQQRFDFDRVPAVVELCYQAGAYLDAGDDLLLSTSNSNSKNIDVDESEFSANSDITLVANRTLRAWETLRCGVQKLLLVYPVKICKYCSEVHVGPSGHKARLCGVFKYESWRGSHFWEKAHVNNLVPPKMVWCRRPQDPSILVDAGRDFYGRAPAVVDLCVQAGAVVPVKYHTMMKMRGIPFHIEMPEDAGVADLKKDIEKQQNIPYERIILFLDDDQKHIEPDSADRLALLDAGTSRCFALLPFLYISG